MRDRARQIEADPALQREWNEYRTLAGLTNASRNNPGVAVALWYNEHPALVKESRLAGEPAMLNFFSRPVRDCEGMRRRDFLKLGALTGLGLSLPDLFAGNQALAKQG